MTNAFPVHFSAQLRQHLRSLRKKQGITQAQLGARIGVSQARIAEIEANPGLVSVDQMLQILSALDTTIFLADATINLPQPESAASDGENIHLKEIADTNPAIHQLAALQAPQSASTKATHIATSNEQPNNDLTNEKLGMAEASWEATRKELTPQESENIAPTRPKSDTWDAVGYAYSFKLSNHQAFERGVKKLGVANAADALYKNLSAQKSLSDRLAASSPLKNVAQQLGTIDTLRRSQQGLLSTSAVDALSKKLARPLGIPVEGDTLADYLATINKNKKGSW